MIKEVSYAGWNRNLRLSGEELELIITLEVGPRVLRCALGETGENVFVEIEDQLGQSGESEWKIRGGHRFWTAPEADHSYALDNRPLTYRQLGPRSLETIEPANETFGFQKTMRVELALDDTVRLTHFLTNTSTRDLPIGPWALTTMRPGGGALIPQAPLDFHPTEFPATRMVRPEDFLPNRTLVLWPFTDLSDGRYTFSTHFLRLAYNGALPATKLGLNQPTGWIAYENQGLVFAKHFSRRPDALYPDGGVNLELFTNSAIFELESLAPAQALRPGQTVAHVEHWALRRSPGNLRSEEHALAFFADLPAIDHLAF